MPDRYPHKARILVAVDCIIFGFDEDELKLLITRRSFEPEKGKFSLIGGFVNRDESLDDAAQRILTKLTGLKNIYMEEVKTFSDVDRDPVERTISVAYYALIKAGNNLNSYSEYGTQWVPLKNHPPLIFDHDRMVSAAHAKLRGMVRHQPVGFELLPKRFSIPQLRRLYEAIYDCELDKRNFSRKILDMDLLEKLNAKDKTTSKKGAYLYKFNKTRYRDLLRKGLNFEI